MCYINALDNTFAFQVIVKLHPPTPTHPIPPPPPLVRESGSFACGIRNPGKLCLWNLESWTLESGIQLKESGIPLRIGIRNPSSTD